MELRHLRYFVAVATERNFTRAAEKLGIAQPPLSRQIRELEDMHGVQLFDRNSRPVALTPAGRLLLDHAERVLGSVVQLESAITRFKSGERRQYKFGFVGSTIYGPIPSLIRRFREAAPMLEIELVEMNTVSQIAALKDGRIDAGLGRLTFEDPAIQRHVIAHENLVVALSVDHPLASATGPLSLADIENERLILYPSEPRPSYADQVLSIFHDYGLRPQDVREVRELQTALGLVSAEAGISLVPSSIQRLRRDDIVYRRISEAGAMSPIILSWRQHDTSPATRALLQICASLNRQEPAIA